MKRDGFVFCTKPVNFTFEKNYSDTLDFDLVISNISQHVRLDRAELDLFTFAFRTRVPSADHRNVHSTDNNGQWQVFDRRFD